MSAVGTALDLVRRLVSPDASDRERAADEVTDVIQALDVFGAALAHMLALVCVTEVDQGAREAQLHALAELDEWGMVPTTAREVLAAIDRRSLVGSQVEYVEALLSNA